MKYIEKKQELAIKGQYDTLIIGGGVAGIAAAIAAARMGDKVCLVEREYALGGLATLGLVAIYLPLCDGRGHQLIGGISEELLKESIKYGMNTLSAEWRNKEQSTIEQKANSRYKTYFDPTSFEYALDKYIDELGIKIMFGTLFSDVIMKDKMIEYIILENKENRFAVQARTIIDSSGDADVCAKSGEKLAYYSENRKTGWYYSNGKNGYFLHKTGESLTVPLKEGSKSYGGISCDEVSEFVMESRKIIFKNRGENNIDTTVTQMPTIPQLRMTRRLDGKTTLIDGNERAYFEDAVGMFGDWRKSGPMYYLPYSSLYGECENLLVAGRCISSDGDLWDITRAIPVCAQTGEIVGRASAIAHRNKLTRIQDVSIKELKDELIKNGNIIDNSFRR
jgi:hypothetical protein